ncbi:hypothetical protein BDQ17DRAFT_1369990 [Cyathus striatus]|nr:hypothetical protein BDQ17DRAFT_1369990 [Cyathus striatus]
MITFLWILQTFHLAVILHCLYYYLIITHGTPLHSVKPIWSLSTQIYFTNISDFCIHMLFTKRIWHLYSIQASRSLKKAVFIFLVCVIFIGASYTMVAGLIYATEALHKLSKLPNLGTYTDFFVIDPEAPLLYSGLGVGVLTDVLIAAALCALLVKNKTGHKRTDSIVANLVNYIINTGLLTSLIAGACFVTYLIWPHNFIFMGIYFVLGSAYYNSLLASLNARPHLRAKLYSVSPILESPSYEFRVPA